MEEAAAPFLPRAVLPRRCRKQETVCDEELHASRPELHPKEHFCANLKPSKATKRVDTTFPDHVETCPEAGWGFLPTYDLKNSLSHGEHEHRLLLESPSVWPSTGLPAVSSAATDAASCARTDESSIRACAGTPPRSTQNTGRLADSCQGQKEQSKDVTLALNPNHTLKEEKTPKLRGRADRFSKACRGPLQPVGFADLVLGRLTKGSCDCSRVFRSPVAFEARGILLCAVLNQGHRGGRGRESVPGSLVLRFTYFIIVPPSTTHSQTTSICSFSKQVIQVRPKPVAASSGFSRRQFCLAWSAGCGVICSLFGTADKTLRDKQPQLAAGGGRAWHY